MEPSVLKEAIKDSLLTFGLYHKINNFRFRHDERNKSQQKFYSTVIGSNDLVFDVGANIGQRSEIFAKLARQVVAVEPQPNCIRHLKSRFKFNRRVKIEQIALGETPGEATMWQSESSGISSMSRRFIDTMGQGVFSDQTWNKEIQVPVRTLDSLIALHGVPAFMKIDVEGYELAVLKGLTQPIPMISFEYEPELIDQARSCAGRVNEISADYQFNYCLGENLEFVLDSNVSYEVFAETTLHDLSQLDTFGDVYAILPGKK
jgi:FkbM family methyltransferase